MSSRKHQVGGQDPGDLTKMLHSLTLQQPEGSRAQQKTKVGHAEGHQEGCVPAPGQR